jgi:hypothetical protein
MRNCLIALTGGMPVDGAIANGDDPKLDGLRLLATIGRSGIIALDKKKRFATLLRQAGMIRTGDKVSVKVTLEAAVKGALLVSALEMLADGLSAYRRLPPEKDPVPNEGDEPDAITVKFSDSRDLRRFVFDGLAPIFEALHHGRKFAVSK